MAYVDFFSRVDHGRRMLVPQAYAHRAGSNGSDWWEHATPQYAGEDLWLTPTVVEGFSRTSFDSHLLDQADRLAAGAGLGPGRPHQSDLRRSVSTAYYALFHFLVAEAVATISTDPTDAKVLCRAFGHAEMKDACRAHAAGRLRAGWQAGPRPTSNHRPQVSVAAG